MNRAGRRSAGPSTLVEMIVVVSIIAILLSLVGVGAVAWINSSKVNGHPRHPQCAQGGDRRLCHERPMASGRGDPRSIGGPNRTGLDTAWWRLGYDAYFGALLHRPTAQIDLITPSWPPAERGQRPFMR